MIDECERQCATEAILTVKHSIIDILMRRPLREKIENHCHVKCIKKLGISNFKKNGRWGFRMVYGCTEICSSLFALLNSVYTIFYYNKYIKPKILHSRLRKLIEMQFYICNAAFLSSTLFHMRDTVFTRHADYLTAYMSIIIGFICALGRLIDYRAPAIIDKYIRYSLLVGALVFALHTYKMVFIKWDYVYNKCVCGSLFALMCICDLIVYHDLRHMKSSKHILNYIAALFVAGVSEVSDRSPIWYLFDTHAMWHLFMCVSSIFYYCFVSGHIDHFISIGKKNN